jgi:hypothetical protein
MKARLMALATLLAVATAGCERRSGGADGALSKPPQALAFQGPTDRAKGGNLRVGAELSLGGSVVRVESLSLTRKLEGHPAVPQEGRELLVVQVSISKLRPGTRLSTVGFQVVLGSGARLTKPGFVTEIELFGRKQRATGSDGATAYLAADAARATLWFDVAAGIRLEGADLEYHPPTD